MTGFLAVLLPALLVLAGLAVDGADAISAREAALGEAAQATRAGVAAVQLHSACLAIDPGAAVAAAESFMAASGHPGTAAVVGDTVVTTVSPYRVPTTFLSLIGIDSFTVSATGAARSVTAAAGGTC